MIPGLHWVTPPPAWSTLDLPVDSPERLAVAREAIADLPADLRHVIVLRDVEERSPAAVSKALGISPEEERLRLQQARSLLRVRLEASFAGVPDD